MNKENLVNPKNTDNKKLLTTKEVARRYSVPYGTLNNWAYKRVGAMFFKVGNRRFYDPDRCDAFFKSNPVLTIDQH